MDKSSKSIKVLVYALLIGSMVLAAVFSVTGTASAQDAQPTPTVQAGSGDQGGQVPVTGESEFANRDIVRLTQNEKTRDYTRYDEKEQGQAECGQSYVVAPGESWSVIVVNCDVPLDTLLAANPQVRDENFLFAGEMLSIPEGSFREITAPRTGLPYAMVFRGSAVAGGVPVTGGAGVAQPTATQAAGGAALPTATQAVGGDGGAVLPTATQAAGGDGGAALPTATQAAGGDAGAALPTATQAVGDDAGAVQPTATQAAGGDAGAAVPTATQAVGGGAGVPVTGVAEAFARAHIVRLTRAEKNRNYTLYDEKQQGQEECGESYVVGRGESLSLIVVNCDVPMDTLMAANPEISDPNILFAGQVLNIPEGSFKEITAPTSGLSYAVIPGWAGVVSDVTNNLNQVGSGDQVQPTQAVVTPVATLVIPTVDVETPVATVAPTVAAP